MAAPDPKYDLAGSLAMLVPGLEVQRNLLDAANAAYVAKGYQPLVAGDVAGILSAANALDLPTVPARYAPPTQPAYTSLPVFPTKLKRFADSNPDPLDQWAEGSPP